MKQHFPIPLLHTLKYIITKNVALGRIRRFHFVHKLHKNIKKSLNENKIRVFDKSQTTDNGEKKNFWP